MKKILFLSLAAILGALSLSCSKFDVGNNIKDPDSKYEFPPYYKIVPPGCTNESYANNLLDLRFDLQLNGADETSSPWVDLGISIATSAAKTIGTKSGEALMEYILGPKPDPTATALREISEQLNDMNKTLNDIRQLADHIMEKLQEIEFNQMNSAYSEQFYRHFSDICNTNIRYYNRLRPDMSEEEMWDVLSEWAGLTIDGSPAPDSFSRIYDIIRNFSHTYEGHPCNVLSVFDACVFLTTPFESEGYDTRDQFRASLATGMSTAALLSSLYFCLNGDEHKLDNIADQLDWLDAFLRLGKEPTDIDINAVVRDNDNIICQIMNARFKLPKQDVVYVRESINGTGWHKGTDMVFLDGDVDITKSRNSQFTMDELKTIQQFFYPGSDRDVSVDVLPILDAYGLVLPKDWVTTRPYLLYKEFEGGSLNRKYNPNKRRWDPPITIVLYTNTTLYLYSGDNGVDVEYGGDSSHEGFGGSFTEFKLLHGFSIQLPRSNMILALGVDKMERY